jgi:alpha-glucosidase
LVTLTAVASAVPEVVVTLQDGIKVAMSTRGPTAIRLRLHAQWHDSFDSPMVHPVKEDAPFNKIDDEQGVGISTGFGSLVVSKRHTIVLRSKSGKVLTESKLNPDHPMLTLTSDKGKLYGRGASPEDANQLTATDMVHPQVCNRAAYAPYYYSTDGYAALGAVNQTKNFKFPVVYASNGSHINWHAWVLKGAFELFFMPAATLAEGTQAYYALIGTPAVSPRYAFGFIASRWGWKDKDYIEKTVGHFRAGGFPLDAIVIDFEWFTTETDYQFGPLGKPWYTDFGYNARLFPDPQSQLPYYRDELHVKFGGLRKPRLGNTELLEQATAKGWILPQAEPGGRWPPNMARSYAWHRNLNYSDPEVRKWYGEQIKAYIQDGVEFWWNDEGETDFFTFYWWNIAENDQLREMNPSKRFFSLNRAWSPGMARLGATVWTGDINPTWEDLRGTPGMMLNWVLSGAPYVACDIGGFRGQSESLLLTRWMQLGVFLPTMRVHSMISVTPHWPWLWGEPHVDAMRQALELRYRLLPYHYSLAHKMYESMRDPSSSPSFWMRPLAMDFPDDPTAAVMTTIWMDGDILVAPVVRQDNQKDVYLPDGLWYERETSHISYGPLHIGGGVDLFDIPQFCRAGTVLPVGNVVQFTDALPGGPIEIQVYGGQDGSFELIEDDGHSYGYQSGQVRRTHLMWNDAAKLLKWEVTGNHTVPGPQGFTNLYVTLFDKIGIHRSATAAIGKGGSLHVFAKRGQIKFV